MPFVWSVPRAIVDEPLDADVEWAFIDPQTGEAVLVISPEPDD